MKMSINNYRALAGLFLILLVGACTTTPLTATSDFDTSYDFSGVRKIAIQPINRTPASVAILSDMEITRIHEALHYELERRGFEVVQDYTRADMLLVWHLVTEERTDVRSFNTSANYNCWSCGSMGGTDIRVQQYTHGTFIIDMIDPARLQSVWRSIFESRMHSESDPASEAEFRRAAAVAVLENFPPKK
jgi:hypothetical protein